MVMGNKISALVVEDNFFLAFELKDHLDNNGYDVIGPTSSLATARDLLERHSPDVVLIDIDMGREGLSYDFASHVRYRDVPFLFISGYDAATVDEAGFDDTPLLSKPVDLVALVREIEQVCSFAPR
jgi:two-component SAPR family response regulator